VPGNAAAARRNRVPGLCFDGSAGMNIAADILYDAERTPPDGAQLCPGLIVQVRLLYALAVT
jgi:hypothetical protein